MQIAPIGGAAGTGVSEAKLTPGAAGGGVPPRTLIQQALLADTAVMGELASVDLFKLTQILQPATPPDRATKMENLIREIVRAIKDDRTEWAVGRFIEAVTTDPTRTDELRSKPEFEPIRANVEHLLGRLTNVAKMDAETKLANAEQLFEKAGWQKLPHWETAPEALIHIAHKLLAAGGYPNYVRTAELANTLLTAYWGASMVQQPPPMTGIKDDEEDGAKRKRTKAAAIALAHHTWQTVRSKLPQRVEALWTRAPLLALFGIWFAGGLSAGLLSFIAKKVWPDSWIVAASSFGYQIWGLGFLGLVGFGFWAKVRRPKY